MYMHVYTQKLQHYELEGSGTKIINRQRKQDSKMTCEKHISTMVPE